MIQLAANCLILFAFQKDKRYYKTVTSVDFIVYNPTPVALRKWCQTDVRPRCQQLSLKKTKNILNVV